MLSRTADSLFWLARYMERAENMARLIDMGRRMTALPPSAQQHGFARRNEWPSILAASGCSAAYQEAQGEPAHAAQQTDAVPFLMLSRDNPSSVLSCFEFARGNARSARSALTRDMWESVNDVWIDFRKLKPEQLVNGAISPLQERIKSASAQFRGATDSSALRNDGYTFLRLGLAIERVDNVARLLDVKSYLADIDDAAVDQYAWSAILRASGLERAYHTVYPADHAARHVLHFLVHNPACPRSLRAGAQELTRWLTHLAALYGARRPCADLADGLSAMIDQVEGLPLDGAAAHEFLSAIIRRNNAVSQQIAEDYHFAPKLAPEPEAAQAPKPRIRAQHAASGQEQSQSQSVSGKSGDQASA